MPSLHDRNRQVRKFVTDLDRFCQNKAALIGSSFRACIQYSSTMYCFEVVNTSHIECEIQFLIVGITRGAYEIRNFYLCVF